MWFISLAFLHGYISEWIFLVISKHYWVANTKSYTSFPVFLHFYFFMNSELTKNLKISQKYRFITEFPILKHNTYPTLM